jgi:hypothetical protein
MELFGLFGLFGALSVIEIVIFTLIFALFVVGTAFDRQGNPGVKWALLLLAFTGLSLGYWSFWSFSGVWNSLFTIEFWKSVGIYFGIGLVYAFFEFLLEIKRAAKKYKARWESFKKYYDGKNEANDLMQFATKHRDNEALINVEYDEKIKTLSPVVNKQELAAYISAWSFFWPAYLVSLFLSDFLIMVFEKLADFFGSIAGRIVKVAFRNIFN